MVPLVGVARLTAVAVAALVMFWALGFQTSFLPTATSDDDAASSTHHLDFIYSVLHPLLMVIGFILITGEAILAHRTLGRWSRGTRKSAHLALQGAAFGFGVFGIWAKFRATDGVVANFLSLHSWMGLLCLSLFATQWFILVDLIALDPLTRIFFFPQWVMGFLSFWHRGEGRRTRASVLPWHVFLGLYTYGLAVATAETGLLEKLTFLQAARGESRVGGASAAAVSAAAESVVVKGLGMGLALLCGVVVLAAVSPKDRHGGRKNAAAVTKGGTGYYTVVHVNNSEHNCGCHHHPRLTLLGKKEAGDEEWKALK